MGKIYRTDSVLEAAYNRLLNAYNEGHRIICTFSGGKDSTVCLELCIMAARAANRLPVEVIMRDEEIMFPGTFEYAERTAARPEVNFHWVYANQPIVNIYNRKEPYFWVFDPLLNPEDWVRQPPSFSYKIPELAISRMVNLDRFPPAPGKDLYVVIGLRTQESPNRTLGLYSSKGWLTGRGKAPETKPVIRNARPIYDWLFDDVWKFMLDFKVDYNTAYDVMHRMGIKRSLFRIAPPTITFAGVDTISMAAKAWPTWFDKVCKRLPGFRNAAYFSIRSIIPIRRLGESWEQAYQRLCIDEAPNWIAERSIKARDYYLKYHNSHSTEPFPDEAPCINCRGTVRTWEVLCWAMYLGDPFCLKIPTSVLNYVEPEFFRPGWGTWGGKPTM